MEEERSVYEDDDPVITESESESEEEDRLPEKISGKRLSAAQRREVCDLYAGGKMKVTALAEKYGVTKSAISQLLKKHGVTWASRVVEEAKAEIESVGREKPPERDPTFADRRQARIEQTREESYNWMRMLAMKSLRVMAEAERTGAPIATLKETIRVYRMEADLLAVSSKMRLEVLEAHEHIDEADLPQIVIRDLTEDDIASDEDDIEIDDSILETGAEV